MDPVRTTKMSTTYSQGWDLLYGPSDFNIGKSSKLCWCMATSHLPRQERLAGESCRWLDAQWDSELAITGFPYFAELWHQPVAVPCSHVRLLQRASAVGLCGGGSNHSNAAFMNASNFAGITSTQSSTTATVNGSTNTTVAYTNKFFAVTPNFALMRLRQPMERVPGR